MKIQCIRCSVRSCSSRAINRPLPALLYGLEACPLRSLDNNSLDFVINRFFMKLFKTNNIETVTYCRMQFNFDLPSTILKKEVIFLLENIGCVVTLFVRL